MPMAFDVGDIVLLKSGGQKMTVESVDATGVTCVWFDKSKLNRATFVTATLEKHDVIGDILSTLKKEGAKDS